MIANEIKLARQKKGLSQVKLANLIGVQTNTVWRWENAKATPDANTLSKVAGALDTTVSQLLGEAKEISSVSQPQENLPQTQAAQDLDALTKEARDSAFQVVCTTHSLCLLENITSKTLHNSPDENNIELIYLTKASGSLKIFRNPQYELILNDLRESTINHQTPVKVYAEDDESRWLLRKLLERTPQNNIMGRVNIVDGITLGCMEAKKLFEKDPTTFGNILFVCDGDVSCTEPHQNFVRLPGNTRPESLIIDFLCNQTDSADFFDQDSSGLMNMGFSWRNFCMERERLKETAVLRQKEREVYKNWFQEKLPYFEQFRLFDYWYDKHQDEAKTFQNSFVEGFNRIAKRLCVPAISPMANGK